MLKSNIKVDYIGDPDAYMFYFFEVDWKDKITFSGTTFFDTNNIPKEYVDIDPDDLPIQIKKEVIKRELKEN